MTYICLSVLRTMSDVRVTIASHFGTFVMVTGTVQMVKMNWIVVSFIYHHNIQHIENISKSGGNMLLN